MTDNLDPKYFERIAQRVAKERTEKTLEKKVRKIKKQSPIVLPNSKSISLNKKTISNGYIFVPALNLYMGKERMFHNHDWYDCHRRLQENGERMPTIPEFIEFLRYLKANPNGVKDASPGEISSALNYILIQKSPWLGEWLDADFNLRNDGSQSVKIYINYDHRVHGSSLVPLKSEELVDCLMEDKTPGISLDEWLNNPTKQGLPRQNISSGTLNYYSPQRNNGYVAYFNSISCLGCDMASNNNVPTLGVRPVRSVAP